MRIALLLALAALGLPACTVTIPEGEFTCSYAAGAARDSACPPSFVCRPDDRCYSSPSVDLGVRDLGPTPDMGPTDGGNMQMDGSVGSTVSCLTSPSASTYGLCGRFVVTSPTTIVGGNGYTLTGTFATQPEPTAQGTSGANGYSLVLGPR